MPLFSLIIISALVSFCLAKEHKSEPAWNGHTPPGAATPAPFTPYHVPAGARGYDSSSPLVHYKGLWADTYSTCFVGGSLRRTRAHGATAWARATAPADMYIDGLFVQRVDAVLGWNYSLPYGKHTVWIVHSGQTHRGGRLKFIDVDAFVVTTGVPPASFENHQQAAQNLVVAPPPARIAQTAPHGWTLVQKGTTGVNAMQLAVVSATHALILDKVEHNPLTVDNRHPAWGALFNLDTYAVTPLRVRSNSFCAGGAFLGNGTLVSAGGNPVVEDHTAPADFGDTGGTQAVRLFAPCDAPDAAGCDIAEYPEHLRLASPRWYATVVRIEDGSVIIFGGSTRGGWMNNATTNNPTVEYFPPKNLHSANGTPLRLQFLIDTLNSNLFPIAFALPDGRIFVAANRDAMIYDWKRHREQRLPRLPNGVRVTYPMTGTALLLPLDPSNGYAPELSAKDPASDQCARLLLTPAGIATGWQVERMPGPRMMPDAVLLPTGAIVLLNGAASGISGYGNVREQVGQSNADGAVYAPVFRFTQGLPESAIPRMYHSTATLTPKADIMIAGSNPNLDRSEVAYGTEYRVEWLRPPYMTAERPVIEDAPRTMGFGERLKTHAISLMDLGFVTHAVHANSRLVYLVAKLERDGHTLTIEGPPNSGVYPPGPGWLYVVVGDVPSTGVKIMVGNGQGPPVDHGAIKNLLAKTKVDKGDNRKGKAEGSE
ncbi:copper radical oxidase [Lactarius akahatsu]|uniref:Copper radical oxidase n=1 Tax=Lactarius akahatsu TaxID=416441 RepID=A0AAD4LEE0_9AGAM|nr:copper radical oxidase [Lactarius akahatsu]